MKLSHSTQIYDILARLGIPTNNQSLSKEELNQQICNLNVHIEKIAKEYENAEYVNTSALLSDASGALNTAYDSGDGIHLTNEAYDVLLTFLYQHIAQTESIE